MPSGSASGATTVPPKPYYNLDASGYQQLEDEFNKLLQQEIDDFMKKYQ